MVKFPFPDSFLPTLQGQYSGWGLLRGINKEAWSTNCSNICYKSCYLGPLVILSTLFSHLRLLIEELTRPPVPLYSIHSTCDNAYIPCSKLSQNSTNTAIAISRYNGSYYCTAFLWQILYMATIKHKDFDSCMEYSILYLTIS